MHPRYKYAILNTSRWETGTITEWIEYYKSIGFDHMYIYCNDDDPFELYTKISYFIEDREPFVTFHHVPYLGQQPACWMHFLDNHKHECEWFMFVDTDEFLALRSHTNINDFMAEREKLFDCIYFNWIWFGPENFEERPSGSTLLNFTHREDPLEQMNYFTKTLTRSACIDVRLIGRPPMELLNHKWPPTIAASLRHANVLGESMEGFLSDFPKSAEKFMENRERREAILQTACINHYLFRSRGDFKRRVSRGTLGTFYFQPLWGNLADNPEEFDNFLAKLSRKEDLFLHDYWKDCLDRIRDRAWATSIIRRTDIKNLALSSTPTQSSVSAWSKGDCNTDARGAISGIHTGVDGFHTENEDSPWWKTDLGHNAHITEIRIFNSLKSPSLAARAYPIVVELSLDDDQWYCIFSNDGNSPFGGADGHPLIIRASRTARYVRVRLNSRDYFHLDEVEIYGSADVP